MHVYSRLPAGARKWHLPGGCGLAGKRQKALLLGWDWAGVCAFIAVLRPRIGRAARARLLDGLAILEGEEIKKHR